jgi:hypothetical protein
VASGFSRKLDEWPPEGQEAMWRHRILACALLTGTLTGEVSAQTPVVFGFLEGESHAYARRAVEGAAARLGRSGCQALFRDFSDVSGQPLSITLTARGKTPVEAFAQLRFVEDRDAPQCVGGATLAFTQIGSRVVRVCGRQFKDRFLGNRTTTEIIMIHEFLHTLGLGENPPTSQAITEQVALRCGL